MLPKNFMSSDPIQDQQAADDIESEAKAEGNALASDAVLDPIEADPVQEQAIASTPSASLAGTMNKMNAKPTLDPTTQKALRALMLKKMVQEKTNTMNLQDSIKQLNLRFFGNQNASFPKK